METRPAHFFGRYDHRRFSAFSREGQKASTPERAPKTTCDSQPSWKLPSVRSERPVYLGGAVTMPGSCDQSGGVHLCHGHKTPQLVAVPCGASHD